MKNILFYGNFGSKNENALNGQVSKTRNFFLYTSCKIENIKILRFNTLNIKKNIFSNFFLLKKMIKNCDVAVILPGSIHSLKFFKLAFGNSRIPVLYPVVGGWLANSIRRKKKIINFLTNIKKIYPETNGLKIQLNELNIHNATVSPTFSLRKTVPFSFIESEYNREKNDKTFRFVYFGRISEKKGIYLAINSIKELNRSSKNKYLLDFYGKLQDGENFDSFYSLLDDNIKYKGVLKDEDVYRICEYDYFLFPSFYSGEGFPACCVESLMFGTPIIASDWKYNQEVVKDGVNGYIFSLEKNDLTEVILKATSNKDSIMSLKKNSYDDGKKYHVDVVIQPFLNDLKECLYEK